MRGALTSTGHRLTVANASCQLSAERLLPGTNGVMTPVLSKLPEAVPGGNTNTRRQIGLFVFNENGSLMLLSDKIPTKTILPSWANRGADLPTSRAVIGWPHRRR